MKYDHDKFKTYYDKECKSSEFQWALRNIISFMGIFFSLFFSFFGEINYFTITNRRLLMVVWFLSSCILIALGTINDINNQGKILELLESFKDLKLNQETYKQLVTNNHQTFDSFLIKNSKRNNFLEYTVWKFMLLYMISIFIITYFFMKYIIKAKEYSTTNNIVAIVVQSIFILITLLLLIYIKNMNNLNFNHKIKDFLHKGMINSNK